MNYQLIVVVGIASSVFGILGLVALMNLRLMQALTAMQNAGNTLVLGMPGFVPLQNGHQPEQEEKDGAS